MMQDPVKLLNKRVFVIDSQAEPLSLNLPDIHKQRMACASKSRDAILHDVLDYEFRIKARSDNSDARPDQPRSLKLDGPRPAHVIMGNYVIYKQLLSAEQEGPGMGAVIGISKCTEDHIRHAHLCQFIPASAKYLCSGSFAVNTKTSRLACFPMSGSWLIFKAVAKRHGGFESVPDRDLDALNVHFAQQVLHQLMRLQGRRLRVVDSYHALIASRAR
jgi:hypothetical protein